VTEALIVDTFCIMQFFFTLAHRFKGEGANQKG
jgi:hypothetical protein